MLSMLMVFLASIPTLLIMSAVPAYTLANTEGGRMCLALAHFSLQVKKSLEAF